MTKVEMAQKIMEQEQRIQELLRGPNQKCISKKTLAEWANCTKKTIDNDIASGKIHVEFPEAENCILWCDGENYLRGRRTRKRGRKKLQRT